MRKPDPFPERLNVVYITIMHTFSCFTLQCIHIIAIIIASLADGIHIDGKH